MIGVRLVSTEGPVDTSSNSINAHRAAMQLTLSTGKLFLFSGGDQMFWGFSPSAVSLSKDTNNINQSTYIRTVLWNERIHAFIAVLFVIQ